MAKSHKAAFNPPPRNVRCAILAALQDYVHIGRGGREQDQERRRHTEQDGERLLDPHQD